MRSRAAEEPFQTWRSAVDPGAKWGRTYKPCVYELVHRDCSGAATSVYCPPIAAGWPRSWPSHTIGWRSGRWKSTAQALVFSRRSLRGKQMPATGARPQGATDEAGAARAVRQMFDTIAPRYDLLNHVLSANVDRLWWRRAARRFRTVLIRPEAAVLDICCGTGDMTMALLRHRPPGARPVLAADFAREMLTRGARKFGGPRFRGAGADAGEPAEPYAVPIEADALRLPLRDASLDLIVTAFGFRNLANYAEGLREFHRVLKPGGQLGILEFSEPGGIIGKAYAVYFRRLLPAIGRLILGPVPGGSGGEGEHSPYHYLPASVGRFPAPAEMLDLMRANGYAECAWQPYTLGIAGLYSGTRAPIV